MVRVPEITFCVDKQTHQQEYDTKIDKTYGLMDSFSNYTPYKLLPILA